MRVTVRRGRRAGNGERRGPATADRCIHRRARTGRGRHGDGLPRPVTGRSGRRGQGGPPELAADPHFRERFRAEVEAARRVGGFHTAPVVDADPDAEAPWLATVYIPGATLAELIERQGPMEEEQLRSLGAALAEALQAVHACGLVHRDLKPGNIIMADDGPRVLDFGIARAVESTRLTATGAAFGTPGDLAPEQAQGDEVGGAADVFALGAVLVAAAGGSAFGTGTPLGLMYRSAHEPADLSTLPGSCGRWSPPASPRIRPAVPRPRSSWARSGRTRARTRTTHSLSPPLTGRASYRRSRSSLPPIPAASTNLSGAPRPNRRARPA